MYRRTRYTVLFYNDPKDKRELSGLTKQQAEEFAETVKDFKIVEIIMLRSNK